MTAPAAAVPVVGDLVARRHTDGTIEVLKADDRIYVSVPMLAADYDAGFYFDGTCLVMAGQVWYRPVGFAQDGRALVCVKERDDRPHIT